ncbi:hypothetical protein [Bosea sp. CS1GBMeth4]|uniref:hypothetical protein n=1 Tax=Bosea sp. CS1GBMeth4 TaxID=1892849 RepID=UPI00164883F3|nr:hypothetical protein [Bosea sp. CS1GBMeth4]
MTFAEARALLDNWTSRLDGKQASTNKTVKQGPNKHGLEEAWWLENDGKTPDWRNGRTVGYLCAYVELAGGAIPMCGIALEDGFLWPDRAVMRALLLSDCVSCRNEHFELTDRGHSLVAPFLRVNGSGSTIALHRGQPN